MRRTTPLFLHQGRDYLQKVMADTSFFQQSVLKQCLPLARTNDPFLLAPLLHYVRDSAREHRLAINLLEYTPLELSRVINCLKILTQHYSTIREA
jgi:hypothetical protein